MIRTDKKPHVVYHIASMGSWKGVVPQQLQLLQEVGLDENVHITYLGKEKEWLLEQLKKYEIKATIVREDENLNHCETFAMEHVQYLACVECVNVPILYMHTKGVSDPGNASKQHWRQLMEAWVVRRWKSNMIHLLSHDAVGVNWVDGGTPHFSGTFWMANSDWIKKLPNFVDYHVANGLHRYTCEMWIGAAPRCNVVSLGCRNAPFWDAGQGFLHLYPPTATKVRPIDFVSFGYMFDHYNSDKNNVHTYGPVYDRIFKDVKRTQVDAVLEVGVLNGESLLAWENSFPNAEVYGLDIVDKIRDRGEKSQLLIANATVPHQLFSTMDRIDRQFDMIVDDASHLFSDQLTTALLLKKYLAEGGVYVIEDVCPASGAQYLAKLLGGFVLDRRGVKGRYDDVMVIVGRDPKMFEDLHNPVVQEIPPS